MLAWCEENASVAANELQLLLVVAYLFLAMDVLLRVAFQLFFAACCMLLVTFRVSLAVLHFACGS